MRSLRRQSAEQPKQIGIVVDYEHIRRHGFKGFCWVMARREPLPARQMAAYTAVSP